MRSQPASGMLVHVKAVSEPTSSPQKSHRTAVHIFPVFNGTSTRRVNFATNL